MRVRESILIIISVGLLSSSVYFFLSKDKIESENIKIKKEFLSYKQNLQNVRETEAKKLKLLKIKQKEKEKNEYREKLYLDVKQKVQGAYVLAQRLKEKYKNKRNASQIIIEALNQRGVYVKNYKGNQVGDINTVHLIDGLRAVSLEEIQKIRRHKEGYIEVKSQNSNEIEYIYVKNLEMNQLFIGASAIFR
jgi:hypothetical protein